MSTERARAWALVVACVGLWGAAGLAACGDEGVGADTDAAGSDSGADSDSEADSDSDSGADSDSDSDSAPDSDSDSDRRIRAALLSVQQHAGV